MKPEKPDKRVSRKGTIQKSPLIMIIAVQKREREKEEAWKRTRCPSD